ncbi:MAG: hypothetical protein AB8H80_17470 [Planctomycetota bacterium]
MSDTDPSRPESGDSTSTDPAAGSARGRRARGTGRHSSAARSKKMKSGATIILVVAVIQLLAGGFFGWSNSKNCDRALEEIYVLDDSEMLELEDGEEVSVAELRKLIEKERIQGYLIPIGLAVAFFALWFWARSSPLPALVSALVLYLAAHALSAVAEPRSLSRGIILKVVVVAGLVSGIKSAVEDRAIRMREGSRPHAD